MIRISGLVIFLLLFSSSSHGKSDISLGLSLGGAEQGDFLLQPSLRVEAQLNDTYLLLWDFYGRDYSKIKERTNMLSFAVRPEITRMKFGFSILFGLSLLNEFTQYTPANSKNRRFNSFNIGAFTGFHWDTALSKVMTFTIAWDAALFPAGIATTYLVTSRKQFITAGLGVKL